MFNLKIKKNLIDKFYLFGISIIFIKTISSNKKLDHIDQSTKGFHRIDNKIIILKSFI